MKILEKLIDAGVVEIKLDKYKKKVTLTEQCDDWYAIDLNYEQMCKLLYELEDMIKHMDRTVTSETS